MIKLTLEKVHSDLSSKITTTNKKLTNITKTLKVHDETLKFLSRKQFESEDRFDGIDKKLESMEKSLTLLNSLPTLHELVHQILRQLTEMRNERILSSPLSSRA